MKKNVMMRVASALLVAVLLTTCAISGTFAKYTTQDSAVDEARVAKWGVELQVVGNLYGETYEDTIVADTSAAGTFTVQSLNADTDVVAPGTKNEEGLAFSLQGTPEVSGEVTAEIIYENIYLNAGKYGVMIPVPADTLNTANYDEFTNLYVGAKGGTYSVAPATYDDTKTYFTLEDEVNLTTNYYPVEYAMTGTGSTVTSYNTGYTGALTIDTLAGMSAVIGECFGTAGTPGVSDGRTTVTYTGTEFNPNEDLQNIVKLGKQKITWKWDYCQENDGKSGDAACDACKADTILGLLQGNANPSIKGEVVKFNDGTSEWKAPTAAAGTALNDYNLESFFSLDITVTQID